MNSALAASASMVKKLTSFNNFFLKDGDMGFVEVGMGSSVEKVYLPENLGSKFQIIQTNTLKLDGGKAIKIYVKRSDDGTGYNFHLGRLNKTFQKQITLNGKTVKFIKGKGASSEKILTPVFDNEGKERIMGYVRSFYKKEEPAVIKTGQTLSKFAKDHPTFSKHIESIAYIRGTEKSNAKELNRKYGYTVYGEQGTLKNFLQKKKISASLIRTAFEDLLLLFAAEICHEDIKPENIIVDKDSQAHIADFDIVEPFLASPSASEESKFSKPKQEPIGGTPLYFFPKGSSEKRVSPVRIALYAFCMSFCTKEGPVQKKEDYSLPFVTKTITQESIASLKTKATLFYEEHWEPSEKKLFDTMLQICEEGWNFQNSKVDTSSREQLASIAKVLEIDQKILTKMALEKAGKSYNNPLLFQKRAKNHHSDPGPNISIIEEEIAQQSKDNPTEAKGSSSSELFFSVIDPALQSTNKQAPPPIDTKAVLENPPPENNHSLLIELGQDKQSIDLSKISFLPSPSFTPIETNIEHPDGKKIKIYVRKDDDGGYSYHLGRLGSYLPSFFSKPKIPKINGVTYRIISAARIIVAPIVRNKKGEVIGYSKQFDLGNEMGKRVKIFQSTAEKLRKFIKRNLALFTHMDPLLLNSVKHFSKWSLLKKTFALQSNPATYAPAGIDDNDFLQHVIKRGWPVKPTLVKKAFEELLTIIAAGAASKEIRAEDLMVDEKGEAHIATLYRIFNKDDLPPLPNNPPTSSFFSFTSEEKMDNPIRAILYAFCMRCCLGTEPKFSKNEENVSDEMIEKANDFYRFYWDQGEKSRQLFERMLQVCQEGWNSEPSDLQEQIRSIAQALEINQARLMELALEKAAPPRSSFLMKLLQLIRESFLRISTFYLVEKEGRDD